MNSIYSEFLKLKRSMSWAVVIVFRSSWSWLAR